MSKPTSQEIPLLNRTRIARIAASALTVTSIFGAMAGVNLSTAQADTGTDARCTPGSGTTGYYMVASDGGVFAKGNSPFVGSAVGQISSPAVGIAPTTSQRGYWVATANGEVRALGDAQPFGNVPSGNIVSIAGTYNSGGYWAVNDRGNIYSFGNAPYLGAEEWNDGDRVVGIVAHPTAMGYWTVSESGWVDAFGAAKHHAGSGGYLDMFHQDLSSPIVGMAASGTGNGYWLVGGDGGIFAFGDAPYFGSTGDKKLNKPVVGMTSLPSNRGYYFVAADGGLFAFGAQEGGGRTATPYCGSMGDEPLNKPIVGMVLQQKAVVTSSTPPATSAPATTAPATTTTTTSPTTTAPTTTTTTSTTVAPTTTSTTAPTTTTTTAPPKTAAEQCIDNKLAALRAAGYEPGAPVRAIEDWNGGKAQHFSNNTTIFHHSTHGCRELHGDVQVKYNQLQSAGTILGYPTTDITGVGAGVQIVFESGIRMYWKNSTIGARIVYGNVLAKYLAVGGPAGSFGFPRTDELSSSCGGGRYSTFEGNKMIVASSYGTFTLTDWMLSGYQAKGGSCGFLGLPSSDSLAVGGTKQVQHFNNSAALYFDGGAGTYTVRGDIYIAWKASIGQSEWWLGYPKGEESNANGGIWAQQFESGGIYINLGRHFVKGLHNQTYQNHGGPNGWLGAPEGSTHLIGAGTSAPYQRTYFQFGRLEYYYSGAYSGRICGYDYYGTFQGCY